MKSKSLNFIVTLTLVIATLSTPALAQPQAPSERPLATATTELTVKGRAAALPAPERVPPAAPAAALADILSEGFEDGLMPPPGWTHIQNNLGWTWYIESFAPHSGNYYGSVQYDPAPDDQDEWLITPDLVDLASVELRFWSNGSIHWCRDTYDNCDLNVWIVIGPGVGDGDDIYIGRADDDWPDSFVYAESVMDLTPHLPGGTVRIGFQYEGNDGAQVNLDDISLTGIQGDAGWLDGYVMDSELGDTQATCTEAVVSIDDGQNAPVNPDGSYGPVVVISGTHTVTATAPGFSTETALVDVTADMTTTQDFNLWRPVISVTPTGFVSITAIVSQELTYQLTLSNSGHITLDFEIREQAPTLFANVMLELESQPGIEIEVESELLTRLATDETSGYIVYLRERPDLSPAFGMDWHTRGWFVMNALQQAAERSQARVRAYLDAHRADYQAFWIDNVIVVESSDRAIFDGLMAFGEIEALRAERTMGLIEPERVGEPQGILAIEPNITHVGADQVWDMGYRGEGMVVANIDTGVRYTHEALVDHYRGNLGGGLFNHDYNWLDPDSGNPAPFDDHGHGSHTIGTMIGDDGASNQIGMAPSAEWIACDACNASDGCPDASLLTCAQWVAAPYPIGAPTLPDPDMRPHVVNNSWGDCAQVYDDWYQDSVDAWHAAGIYPVFSNGNASNCSYPEPPGCNTVGNPARYGNVTGVGSTGQSNGQYASHSNWGPTDDADTVNPRGYPNLKPQVAAPGVVIRSSLNASDSHYASWGGTSMSAPHVSALVALMWQAGPCLIGDYATTETLLEETATPIPYASGCGGEGPGNVPNHATGWGEINALAAVQAAQNYCGADLPWVWTDPISGTIPAPGGIAIDVTFYCTETRDYKGTLIVLHNDPCEANVELPIVLRCTESPPQPTWNKEVWVNDVLTATWPVTQPLTVVPSDTIRIVDRVSISYTDLVTFTLSEEWNDSLTLASWEYTIGAVMTDAHALDWSATGVATDTWYALTKTFTVEEGIWIYDYLTETLDVEGALAIDERALPYLYRGRCVHLEGITITGVISGLQGVYTFTTAYIPLSATLPVDYLWDNGDLTDTSVRSLDVGTHTLTVTATNCIATVVNDKHTITVIAGYDIYLPVILK